MGGQVLWSLKWKPGRRTNKNRQVSKQHILVPVLLSFRPMSSPKDNMGLRRDSGKRLAPKMLTTNQDTFKRHWGRGLLKGSPRQTYIWSDHSLPLVLFCVCMATTSAHYSRNHNFSELRAFAVTRFASMKIVLLGYWKYLIVRSGCSPGRNGKEAGMWTPPGSWVDPRRSLFAGQQDKPALFAGPVVKLTGIQMRDGTVFYKNEKSARWCHKNSCVNNVINIHL